MRGRHPRRSEARGAKGGTWSATGRGTEAPPAIWALPSTPWCASSRGTRPSSPGSKRPIRRPSPTLANAPSRPCRAPRAGLARHLRARGAARRHGSTLPESEWRNSRLFSDLREGRPVRAKYAVSVARRIACRCAVRRGERVLGRFCSGRLEAWFAEVAGRSASDDREATPHFTGHRFDRARQRSAQKNGRPARRGAQARHGARG